MAEHEIYLEAEGNETIFGQWLHAGADDLEHGRRIEALDNFPEPIQPPTTIDEIHSLKRDNDRDHDFEMRMQWSPKTATALQRKRRHLPVRTGAASLPSIYHVLPYIRPVDPICRPGLLQHQQDHGGRP